MRPSRLLLKIAIIGTLLALLVTLWPVLTPILMLGTLALVVIAAMDALLLPRRQAFSVSRTLPGRFALGVPAEVQLRLEQHATRPLQVSVADGIPEAAEAAGLPWQGVLPAQEAALLCYDLHFTERGLHRLDRVEILASSPLRLWQRRLILPCPGETRCYPNYEPVVRFALLATAHREEQMGIVRRRRTGAALDFHQLREYQDGDVLSRVDWKATARRNQLISRDYEEARNQTVLLVPDCGHRLRTMDGEVTQFDHCLNAMLLLAYMALRQGDEAGVLGFGGVERWLKPVKGAHSMPRILNHLYDYQPSEEPGDFTEAAQRIMLQQRRRALVVFLTNLRSEDASHVIKAARLLKRRHLVMVASLKEMDLEEAAATPVATQSQALAYGALCAYFQERQSLVQILRKQGVHVVDDTAKNLPIALANAYLDLKASGAL